MKWVSTDMMDRWPAAAFRACCVFVAVLDRLWHLVSTAVQYNDPETQHQVKTRVTAEREAKVPKSHETFGRGGEAKVNKQKSNKPKAVETNERSQRRGLCGRIVNRFKKGRLSKVTNSTREDRVEQEEGLRWTIHLTFYSLFSAY